MINWLIGSSQKGARNYNSYIACAYCIKENLTMRYVFRALTMCYVFCTQFDPDLQIFAHDKMFTESEIIFQPHGSNYVLC